MEDNINELLLPNYRQSFRKYSKHSLSLHYHIIRKLYWWRHILQTSMSSIQDNKTASTSIASTSTATTHQSYRPHYLPRLSARKHLAPSSTMALLPIPSYALSTGSFSSSFSSSSSSSSPSSASSSYITTFSGDSSISCTSSTSNTSLDHPLVGDGKKVDTENLQIEQAMREYHGEQRLSNRFKERNNS
jgi:hypothetical protein